MSDRLGFHPPKSWHDMGGDPAGPIVKDGHDFALWEKRIDAMVILLGLKGRMSVDQLRCALEELGETAFESMAYYERWVAAANRNMLASGVYSVAELGTKMDEVARRGTTYGDAARG